jgi:hypothetical protein
MFKSIAQVIFRNLGQKTLWLSLLIGIGMLSITELLFEPVIDHFLEGSFALALGFKLVTGIILRPLETKIETKTLTYANPSDSLLSEDDDNWARVLIRVYRTKHLKAFENYMSTEDDDTDNWTRILMRLYRTKFLVNTTKAQIDSYEKDSLYQ